MNQQQLQTARTALWHQTAPLDTGDEATTWLEDLGLCLFLPRHAQLPAPAPSFVEAVHGSASAAPPPSALERAGELASRLVDERKAVPLNLLGTFSEQPDFLITPEVLPWVAAVRGDRQWNAAPGGRTAPLVVRTWQVLDREGEATAVELRELLGRELTEAAILRALVELWTTVRAVPLLKPGETTRWTLLKNRFPAQMATGGNKSQAMALSALLSIYLRSAVAATAEEAEIFLSPLTARSRIREVLHAMTASRQFGSMSVGSQTLLFVEGSLPEHLPLEVPDGAAAEKPSVAEPPKRMERPASPPFRKEFRKDFRKGSPEKREGRGQAPGRLRPPFQKMRPEQRGGAKPWQQRRPFGRQEGSPEEPGSPPQTPRAGEKRPESRPWDRKKMRPDDRRPASPKPWQRREASTPGGRGGDRPPNPRRFEREGAERPPKAEGEHRSERTFGQRFGRKFGQQSGRKFESSSGAKFGRKPGGRTEFRSFGTRDAGGKKPGGKPFGKRPGGDRSKFPPRREAGEAAGTRGPGGKPFGKRPGGDRAKFPPRREPGEAAGARGPGGDRSPRFGKPQRREDARRPFGRNKKTTVQGRKNFRKANPGEQNSRKNRNQEEKPE